MAKRLAVGLVLLLCLQLSYPALARRAMLPQGFQEYKVLFTNPECREYPYASSQDVRSVSGEKLEAKPKNAYCTLADRKLSANRPSSPEYQILEWIELPETKEMFFTALSFSNAAVADALCEAVEQRSIKVRFVLDKETDLSTAKKLLECKPTNPAVPAPQMFLRGRTGSIGFAHNKFLIVNPGEEKMRIAFGSGNMSAGTALHHENWHFITLSGSTYFAQVHLCVVDGMIEHGTSKKEFADHMGACRKKITAPQEREITTYFVPGEGGNASRDMFREIQKATEIRIAAHRFSYTRLITNILEALSSNRPPLVQFVSDDDIYWAGKGEQPHGGNQRFEFEHVKKLQDKGMTVKYMETNGVQNLFHHNKYLIFNGGGTDSVFTGAGNLTTTAFTDNFENFYLIRLPQVVETFNRQYDHMWNDLATDPQMLPWKNVLPPGSNAGP